VVKAANRAALSATDLRTKEKLPAADPGDFTSGLDGRMRLVHLNVVLGQKKSWSYSFEPRSMQCIGCRNHLNTISFPMRGSGARSGRQVIWLADQSMPALLPSPTALGCIKIVRLESGMLRDLAEGLVLLLSGRQLAAGSIVLMTSATNMSLAGTAGYTEDLVATIKYLRSHLGDHLLYGVLPNMFVNGCADPLTIRVNAEINTWAKSYFGACDTLLSNSISLAEKQIKERGGGSTQTDFRCVVRLPSSLHSPGAASNFSTGGWDDLPANVRPPSWWRRRSW
jgi:hypothetical protein